MIESVINSSQIVNICQQDSSDMAYLEARFIRSFNTEPSSTYKGISLSQNPFGASQSCIR